MRQRLLDHVVGEVGALRRPIAEGRSESMHSDIATPHPPEHGGHRHVGQPGAGLGADEHEVVAVFAEEILSSSRRAELSGIPMLFAGLHPAGGHCPDAGLRSISSQRAPIASPVRAAVRMVNSSACAATPSRGGVRP